MNNTEKDIFVLKEGDVIVRVALELVAKGQVKTSFYAIRRELPGKEVFQFCVHDVNPDFRPFLFLGSTITRIYRQQRD